MLRVALLRVLRCELHDPRLHAVPRQDAGADWVHQRGGRDPKGAEGCSRVLTRHSRYSRVLTRHAGADSVHQRSGRRLCARSCASRPGCAGRMVDLPIYRARGTRGYSHGTPGDSSRTPESVCRRRGSTCRSSARRPSRPRRCFNNIMCATTVHIIRRCSAITASAERNVQHQL
jgi:hypothetical protein